MDGLRGWKQGSSGQINYLYAGGVPICEINGSGGVAAVNTWGPAGLYAFMFKQTGKALEQSSLLTQNEEVQMIVSRYH